LLLHNITSQTSTLSLHDALPIFASDQIGRSRPTDSPIISTPPRARSDELRDSHDHPDQHEHDDRNLQPDPGTWHPPDSLVTASRSEEHTSELQSRVDLVCRLLLE